MVVSFTELHGECYSTLEDSQTQLSIIVVAKLPPFMWSNQYSNYMYNQAENVGILFCFLNVLLHGEKQEFLGHWE